MKPAATVVALGVASIMTVGAVWMVQARRTWAAHYERQTGMRWQR